MLPTARRGLPCGAPEGAQAALVFLAGNIASGTPRPGAALGGNVFYDLDGSPGCRIELLAGHTLLGVDSSASGVTPGAKDAPRRSRSSAGRIRCRL